jgi:hypothetical protein
MIRLSAVSQWLQVQYMCNMLISDFIHIAVKRLLNQAQSSFQNACDDAYPSRAVKTRKKTLEEVARRK